MSFDWNQVRAFLATAEEGSFGGAARALALSEEIEFQAMC